MGKLICFSSRMRSLKVFGHYFRLIEEFQELVREFLYTISQIIQKYEHINICLIFLFLSTHNSCTYIFCFSETLSIGYGHDTFLILHTSMCIY